MLVQEAIIEIVRRPEHAHPQDKHLSEAIHRFLGVHVQAVRTSTLLAHTLQLSDGALAQLAHDCLCDPLTEDTCLNGYAFDDAQWSISVFFKPGLTDSLAGTVATCTSDYLGRHLAVGEKIRSGRRTYLWGDLCEADVERISNELLANPLIEQIQIRSMRPAEEAVVQFIELPDDSAALLQLSKDRQLALSLEEMQAIRSYYADIEVQRERRALGLPAMPSDVEIEALAQTWSEHCKHKIFAAKIHYRAGNTQETIHSLFRSYICAATDLISKERDWLVSVFKDNAGIIRFTESDNIAFKVETHNSPSALDPYGGALTGILGVNRDIMGTGCGARLLANTDVFCFGPPHYNKPMPERLLHPRRIFEGVRRGVEHGGNKSGVPTVNGSIVFDERFIGKPLVYCGTVGILPRSVRGQASEHKEILSGDCIVIAGGRTGKDGIHGATFSSEELSETSPLSAVQIGDPFTQKKLLDFIIEARDQGLYRTLTDNGAGGFSSSVGELAELSGGCHIELDRAPLKYEGLKPWEILLSESQERMTLAVDPARLQDLEALAAKHEVELACIGTFNSTGSLHCSFQGQTVAFLSMHFLHDGVPELELDAEWVETSSPTTVQLPPVSELESLVLRTLSRPNVCSKEQVIRQYDHEVQGGSIVKPLCGVSADGPSDAAVVWPLECMGADPRSYAGVVVSHGICPRYSDIDTYHMAQCALDEAIRNAVATGADPSHLAVLDNFCWPDPVYDAQKTPDGKYKLAQLVRACKGLFDAATAFGTPFISGKDSMKNDYRIGDLKISIPPTLLVSAIGRIPDVRLSVTMDFKAAGEIIYLLGRTRDEIGASAVAQELGIQGGQVPTLDASEARKLYECVHSIMQEGWITACHDLSDGGLAIAAAEAAFAGGIGCDLDLAELIAETRIDPIALLFSESPARLLVSVPEQYAQRFEERMASLPICRIGQCKSDSKLRIRNASTVYMDTELASLKEAWQTPLL
ncbi:MAG: phosphoribosylformylglycinamidine synthase subunit PurL [Chlamydiia bacterium]|nr:phosphoribosylformylglycinamidine synthase subunit PurL [Chlamydiia bacterium]